MGQTHQVLRDELGGRVYPSGEFGAKADCLRLQVLTTNLLTSMKAVGFDEENRNAQSLVSSLRLTRIFGLSMELVKT